MTVSDCNDMRVRDDQDGWKGGRRREGRESGGGNKSHTPRNKSAAHPKSSATSPFRLSSLSIFVGVTNKNSS
jgi:hypothetical protein